MSGHVAIAGLGRCGTSLVMQMLAAGGMPCIGEYPAYEPPELGAGVVSYEFMNQHPDHAFKWLDPKHVTLPYPPVMVIWLTRNRLEQAKSQVKFAQQVCGMRMQPHAVRGMTEQIGKDEAWAKRITRPAHTLHFELLINSPRVAAGKLAKMLAPFATLDVEAMAAQVVKRRPGCERGMDIEVILTERGGWSLGSGRPARRAEVV